MKKKKVYSLMIAVMVALNSCVLFGSCSDDEDFEEQDVYTLSGRMRTRSLDDEYVEEIIGETHKKEFIIKEVLNNSDYDIKATVVISWDNCIFGQVFPGSAVGLWEDYNHEKYQNVSVTYNRPILHNGSIITHYIANISEYIIDTLGQPGIHAYPLDGDIILSYRTCMVPCIMLNHQGDVETESEEETQSVSSE